MQTPKITVAVPILNEVSHIALALDSLAAQTYKNIDVQIIDGGSTDGTLEILERYNFPVRVIKGLGQMASINKVWQESDAKYVTWMAGDDELYLNAFENLVNALEANPEAAFAHGPADVIDGDGNFMFSRPAKRIGVDDLLKSYCMLPQTGLIRRSILEKSGYTDDSLRLAADHDLYLRLSFFGDGVATKEKIAKFRIHEGSEDAQNFANVGRQTIYVVEKNINSDLGKAHLTPDQVKKGKAHSRIVGGNFVITNTKSFRKEAFSYLVNAVSIFPSVVFDAKFIRLLIRLVIPVNIPPNFLRKKLKFLS